MSRRLGFKRHFIIPDRQIKPNVPLEYNRWLGMAIKEYEPDEVIDIGDNNDFSSLSYYATAREREGRRLKADIDAANRGEELLLEGMDGYEPDRKWRHRGNHEERLQRFLNDNPVLEGLIGEHLLSDEGWNIIPYWNGNPKVNEIDGISYAHYFTHVNTGKAIGGTASYKLTQIGSPFVQGHVQGYDIGTKQFATGRTIRGVVIGSCYMHDEEYKGMANNHWRGALILNEVRNGQFSEMPLTLDYLCYKYEGMTIKRYLQRKYKNAKSRFSLAS